MSSIIEHGDNNNDRTLRVGDTNSQVSVKAYQDIYHQITGRTEQIRKRYSDNILVEFTDIEQLHFKVMQLCDVHHVVARNETVSVFHARERKEQFTSFERFRIYNSNATSPSVNVVLKYNFSITPGGLQKPQEYVVTVRLTSRVALLQQAEEDAPPFMRGNVISILSSSNIAEISVEYADYVVARGFVEAFDEWIRGCKSTPKSKLLTAIQRVSHLIPQAIRLCIVLVIAWYALETAPAFFANEAAPLDWARFIILYSTGTFFLLSLCSTAGEIIEGTVDNFPVLSYLKLNKGDERLISEFQRKKTNAVIKLTASALFTIVLGILSAKLEKLL